jgi:Spx/MgsR family transcriptional regulator
MTDAVTLFGISNCDTIKKARNWLQEHAVEYRFHDYRKQGVDGERLQSMASQLGWEVMLNRRGTTWRALPDPLKEQIDEASALQLMLDNPAIIKRPILEQHGNLHIGFKPQQYQEIFKLQ